MSKCEHESERAKVFVEECTTVMCRFYHTSIEHLHSLCLDCGAEGCIECVDEHTTASRLLSIVSEVTGDRGYKIIGLAGPNGKEYLQ